jgi:hypothetical protein
VLCSIGLICLARGLYPITNCVNARDDTRTFATHSVILRDQSTTSPGLCRLDIMNSNLPPSNNWLCEIMGLGISSLSMVN